MLNKKYKKGIEPENIEKRGLPLSSSMFIGALKPNQLIGDWGSGGLTPLGALSPNKMTSLFSRFSFKTNTLQFSFTFSIKHIFFNLTLI